MMNKIMGYYGPEWVCYLWFVGWGSLSLGLSVSWDVPNLEIHLPFCFLRVGRQNHRTDDCDCGWLCWSWAMLERHWRLTWRS